MSKTGSGSPRDEWVLRLAHGDKTGCEALAACVGESAGQGLVYDEATETLQVRLSRDAGQRTRFGSDGGLLTTFDGDGPGAPEFCGKSVDNLPEMGIVGAYLLAGLINPFNSPYGLEYCIQHNIDVSHVRVGATADGVGWLAEYRSANVTESRSSVFASGAALELDAATIASTRNEAGAPGSPTPEDGGGWYGWLAPTYQNWFLPELLQRANGKTVVLADCTADEREGFVSDEGANVAAALRAGRQMCAANRMLVGVENLENAQTVVNAGFTPIMMSQFEQEALRYGEEEAPYPVADLQRVGVAWAGLSEKYSDSVFEAYQQAGVSVLMMDSARQYVQERADRLARGRLNLDPVYARGVGSYDYRGSLDVWERKRMCVGQLSHMTDDWRVTGVGPRGYTKLDSSSGRKNGLVLPARFGGGWGRPTVLVGVRSPMADPEGYTVTWQMQAETLPTGRYNAGKIGIMFGSETDAGTFGFPADDPQMNPSGWPDGQREINRAYLRVDGRLGIGTWDENGVYQRYEVETAQPRENDWMSFELSVTPDRLVFRRLGDGGGEVEAEADVHRGPYLFIEKEELHPEDDAYGFRAGFTMPKVT